MSVMYYIAKVVGTQSVSLLGKDWNWLPLPNGVSSVGQVMSFEHCASAQRAQRGLPSRTNTFIWSDGTLKEKFGVSNLEELVRRYCGKKAGDQRAIQRLPESAVELIEPGPTCGSVGAGCNLESVYETPFIQDALDLLERLQVFVERAEEIRAAGPAEEQAVDRKLCDEAHFMEFFQLNGADGYRAYKRYHDLRVERRRIKNEEIVAMVFLQVLKGGCTASGLKGAINSIRGIPGRVYTPRVYWPGEREEA